MRLITTLFVSLFFLACPNGQVENETRVLPSGLYAEGPASSLRAYLESLPKNADRPLALEDISARAIERLSKCEQGYTSHAENGRVQSLLESIRCDASSSKSSSATSHSLWLPGQQPDRTKFVFDLGQASTVRGDLIVSDSDPHALSKLLVGEATTALPWSHTPDAIAWGAGHASDIPVPDAVFSTLGIEMSRVEKLAMKAGLTGRWAFSLLPPKQGLPPIRLRVALESESADLLTKTLRAKLTDVQERFGVTIVKTETPQQDGLVSQTYCAKGLKLVPGFSPCIQTWGRWLIIAWNASSLPESLESTETTTSINIDFKNLAGFDLGFRGAENQTPLIYPFDDFRIEAKDGPDANGYSFVLSAGRGQP